MLLGFKKRFAPAIISGIKIFTVRRVRKIRPKVGETLYMYTGLRTRNSELITNKEKLKSWQKIRIMINRNSLVIRVDGRKLNKAEIADFVRYDGFIDKRDFIDYWRINEGDFSERTVFIGEMYHWTNLKY